jgi:hypothetical protein|tara:strand:- start:416 stop:622 length:207 start_codon:yes stop_codon:yes gene_type:complete
MAIYESWSIGEEYRKVHIKNYDAYLKIKEFLEIKSDTYYSKDGTQFAWDVVVNEKQFRKVKRILKEFS